MGEYADYMLNGDDCQSCGEYLGGGDGYPRNCAACDDETHPGDDNESKRLRGRYQTPPAKNKTDCELCGKRVFKCGLAQHMAAKHPGEA